MGSSDGAANRGGRTLARSSVIPLVTPQADGAFGFPRVHVHCQHFRDNGVPRSLSRPFLDIQWDIHVLQIPGSN